MRLLAGRLPKDDRADTPHVILINRSLAERFWPSPEAAVGNQLSTYGGIASIVGVVDDTKQIDLAKPPAMEIYFPLSQAPGEDSPGQNGAQQMTVVARVSGWPNSYVRPLQKAIHSVDSAQPVYNVKAMTQVIDDSIAARGLTVRVLISFTIVALILTLLAVYATLSNATTMRTAEFGVRLALGAQRHQLITNVLAGATRLLIAGIGIGMLASWMLMRGAGHLLYGVRATDPLTISIAVVIIIVAGLIAAFLPAWRAAHVDPVRSLRCE